MKFINALFGLVFLCGSAVAQDCCDVTGRGSGHIFGMIMAVIGSLAVINILKTTPCLENAFIPGTSSFCRRMLFTEFADLVIVIFILFAADSKVSDADEEAYTAFIICNAVVIVWLIVYWSKPCQKMNIFLGNPEDRGKRKKLTNLVRHARTTITGRKLISDSLRAEVEGFNQRMVAKDKMAKTMALHVAFFKIFDVVMLGYQYSNICDSVVCSFFKQIGTLALLGTFYMSIEDVYRLRTGRPKIIDLKKEEGRGKASFKDAKMKPIEAYNLVRDLIYEIVEVGKVCASYMAADSSFRKVTLQIHDWETNPERDPRIDACMWSAAYSMALSNAMLSNRHLSVTALHLANAAMKDIRDQLQNDTVDRVKLLRSVAALYQTCFHSLPEEDKEWLYENIAIWAEEARTLDDPMQYTVLFLGQILPDGYDSPESVVDAISSLSFFYDDVTRDLLSGRDIHILDDATMEWVNMNWALLKQGFDSRDEINQIDAYIEGLMIIQNPVMLHEAATVLEDFRRRQSENANISVDLLLGGMATRFEELLKKAEDTADAEGMGGPRKLGANNDTRGTPEEWIQKFLDVAGGENGSITRSQFRKMYLAFGVKPTPLELNRYFADDKLDYDEFCEFVENHNYGGYRSVIPAAQADTIVPSVTTDRVPKELVRVKNAEGTDEFAPLSVKMLASRLNEDLDVRSFSNESHTEIRASVTSPLLKNKNQTRGRAGTHGGGEMKDSRSVAKRASNVMNKKKASGGGKKGFDFSWKNIKNILLDNTFYIMLTGAYWYAGINALRFIGNDNKDDIGQIAYLGIPPTYIYQDPHIPFMVPIVYALMHMTLLTFALLPLTMCRWTIRQLSEFETLGRFFRIEHAYFWHRRAGYNLSWGILLGGAVWWCLIMYSCTEEASLVNDNAALTFPKGVAITNQLRCEAFFPQGRYFDFYVNGASVVFLRELVIASLSLMVGTSGLIFERSIPWKNIKIKVHKAYEIFYYAHCAGAYAIAVLALTSRWDVFYPTMGAWGLYIFDVIMMYTFNTHPTRVAGANCFSQGSRAVVLKLRKPRRFQYHAGQTCFLKIPKLSWLEWHPFSIASSPKDENVEFVIDCSHGENQWTDLLFKACEDRGTHIGVDKDKGAHNMTAFIYGPSGSSFQAFDQHKGIMLIGGGSGLPSSLSVIRHIFYARKGPNKIKATNVNFVWSTRTVDSLLWCWDQLKARIEDEIGFERRGKWTPEHDEALAHLASWLELSISVTKMTPKNFNDLIEIEKQSQVGSWMVHRLSSGRVANWTSVFQRFHASVGSDEIKVFFCGPPAMARAIRAGAKDIEGFHVEVSSENFHDS